MAVIKNRFTGEIIAQDEEKTLTQLCQENRRTLRGADLHRAQLYEADLRFADLREAGLREANLRRADLRVADLRGADLRGATLRGSILRLAYLRDAKWTNGARLIGERPYMEISPVGSENGILISVLTDRGHHVQRGCFKGSLSEFVAAVENKHADSKFGPEYRAAIELLKAHAATWMPDEGGAA